MVSCTAAARAASYTSASDALALPYLSNTASACQTHAVHSSTKVVNIGAHSKCKYMYVAVQQPRALSSCYAPYVVFTRVVEEYHVLRHHANGSTQRGQRNSAYVLPVDADGATGDIVKAVEEPETG